MSVKTILVAHGSAAVRDRLAAALAEARHAFVPAATDVEALARARDDAVSLALVDLRLAEDGVRFVRALGEAAGRPTPIIVFSSGVSSADHVAALSAVPVAGYLNDFAPLSAILPALAPHLFPDNFNRRGGPRVLVAVPVSFQIGRTITAATTFDVAPSGLGIRTMEPLPQGTALDLVFRLPGQTADVRATGRVSWSDRNVGMGVRFERIGADGQSAIDRFVDERA